MGEPAGGLEGHGRVQEHDGGAGQVHPLERPVGVGLALVRVVVAPHVGEPVVEGAGNLSQALEARGATCEDPDGGADVEHHRVVGRAAPLGEDLRVARVDDARRVRRRLRGHHALEQVRPRGQQAEHVRHERQVGVALDVGVQLGEAAFGLTLLDQRNPDVGGCVHARLTFQQRVGQQRVGRHGGCCGDAGPGWPRPGSRGRSRSP